MSWRLLEQTAATLGLNVRRAEHGPRTQVTIEFPRVANEALEGASAVELEAGDPLQLNSQPLAGSHVLVLAPTRELRNLVREALRGMGLVVDYTSSVDEAREFCRGGMPHAIVYEGAVGGAAVEALRDELLASVPSLAFIRLADEGKAFEVLSIGNRQLTSVGRDAIVGSLPSALMFELARCH
jgi:CheY-like chemotaxis protein